MPTLLRSSPAIQLLSESFHTSLPCSTPARSIVPRGRAHPLAHPPDTHELRIPLIRGSACQFRRRHARSPWYRPQSTSVRRRRSCSNKNLLPLTLPAAPRKVLVATMAPSAFRWLGPWSRGLLMDPPGSCHQHWLPRGERAQGTWSRALRVSSPQSRLTPPVMMSVRARTRVEVVCVVRPHFVMDRLLTTSIGT